MSSATTLAFMVGVVEVLAGALRPGVFVDSISAPVVLGYITGAAVFIALGQLPNLTQTPMHGAHLPAQIASWLLGRGGLHPLPFALPGGTTVGLVVLRLVSRWAPGALLAMFAGIALEYTFFLHERGIRVIGRLASRPRRTAPADAPAAGSRRAATACRLCGHGVVAGGDHSFAEGLRSHGRHFGLVGMRPPVTEPMEAFGLADVVGRDSMFPTEERWFVEMDRALLRVRGPAGEHEEECPVERYLATR